MIEPCRPDPLPLNYGEVEFLPKETLESAHDTPVLQNAFQPATITVSGWCLQDFKAWTGFSLIYHLPLR